MPSLQELAYRNSNRGVSVYSPTRPVIRPTGTMANSGTAQRIMQGGAQGARQPGQFNVTAPSTSRSTSMQLPSYRPPDQAGQGRTPLDDILDSMGGAPAQQQEEQGGWRGALGTVVNSMPFKAVMAPLNILDIPRRAAVSTINEVADVFNGGDASWDDWFDQVKDPNFGVGSVVGSTGNLWADRVIGFAGDVLLDPLTYVAGAGVFSGTGRTARTRLASLAAAEGLGEDVIRSVGRYGLSGVDNATRARLRTAANLVGDEAGEQILDRGYYLKVPFADKFGAQQFRKIPGTAALDRVISPAFARGRCPCRRERFGTTLRNRLRTPEVMREATEKLITGRGKMSFDDAAGIYLYTNAQRRLGNTATNRFLAEATKLTSTVGGRPLNEMIDLAETTGGTALNAIFERANKFMTDAGISFYPRKNYVPHILTQNALEWFRSASKPAADFRAALIPGLDLDDLSPRLMERHLLAGTTAEIGVGDAKRAFNAGAGTIKDINAEFKRVFPELKFKLFDDEISSIFAVYGRHLGDDVGRAGGLKTLLNSKSRLVRLRSDDDMVKTLIDEEGLDLLNKQTADMLRADHKALTDRVTRLRQEQVNDTLGLQGVLGVYMRETVDDLENVEQQLKDELDQLIVSESALSHQMGRTSAMTGEAPASNLGTLEVKLQDAYQRLEQRAMAADQRLAGLQQRAASENAAWKSLQRMAGFDSGMMTVPEKFQALRTWNIAAAEAASLAMDREAVSTMRIELANLIRKADLAEELADNPATVGLRGKLELLSEERVGASVRLNADGQLVEYIGPTSGLRGQRENVEEALRREVSEETGERAARQRRLTVATSRIRWDPDDKVHDVITQANKHREAAIKDIDRLSITPARQTQEQLNAQLLPPEAETELVGRYNAAQQAMQTDPDVVAYQQAQAELPRIETELAQARDNLTKTPRSAAGDRRQQAIADAQERIDRLTGPGTTKVWRRKGDTIELTDKRAAKALPLYERYARLARGGRSTPTTERLADDITKLMGPYPGVRNPRVQALAQADKLAAQRKALQKDIDLTIKGPGQLDKLKRDPARVALEDHISALEARQKQLQTEIAAGEAKTAPLRQQLKDLENRVAKQRDTYTRLQRSTVPDNTATVLLEMNDRILAKQAQLGEEENRLARLAEMHRDNIDDAEHRVEAAVNMDAELRRRERDAWGTDEDTVRAARQAVADHRDSELHAAKQAFEDAQKPVARARARRDSVRRELEQAKDTLASSEWTPPEVGAQIAKANTVERSQVRVARAQLPTVKTEWRIFPEIDAPPRRGAYTFEQRDRLEELYNIVRNTHPVDRAGASGAGGTLVRQARETIATITAGGGPHGPRERIALTEAHSVLASHRAGRMNNTAHRRYRAARDEINAIERSVAQSVTYAQHEFGEVRRIGGMLEQLEEIRVPLAIPGKGSKNFRAIAGSPRPPGGDRSVLGRAKENHELAEDWIDNFSQDLIDTGAIDDSHVEFISRQRDEVRRLLDVHKLRKTPDVKSQLTQASNDLGRLVDVMLSYQASIARDTNRVRSWVQRSQPIASMRERNTLDDSITEIQSLLKIKPEDRIAVFQKSVDNYEAKIALEQKIIDNPETDEIDRKNAVLRRNNARRQLGKKIDAGVVTPGTGDLRGIIEDDMDSMTDLIMEQVDEFDAASNELRAVSNWRDVYTEPVEKRGRLQANTGRLELQSAHLSMAKTRLEKAIARARSSRSKTVQYRPTTSTSFTETISAAERRIDAGEIPDEMVPVVRNELRIAERRQAPNAPEREIQYSITGRANEPTQMTIAEAEAELARYPMYMETIEKAKRTNQFELETMTGESAKRITTLETLITESEAPLNEAGIKALKQRAREIDTAAKGRPGRSLKEKRLPEEEAELDEIAARIELSTSPPDPERLATMQAELAERQGYRERYERAMVYDYELMGHVEDNGYRMLRDLTQNLRAPTKAEARFMRQLIGAEQGEEVRQVLAFLDDVIHGASTQVVTNERMEQAIRMIQSIAETRRSGDDALDRILPTDEAGRALNFEEMTRAAQVSSEVATVLGSSGRASAKTLDAEGFRENFFQVLTEAARNKRQEAEREIKHLVGWLDMTVNEDIVSTIGIVNKYFGGKLRPYTKKEKAAMRAANQPIPKLRVRRREAIRQTIVEAMQSKGYDPAVSLQRKLREAQALRSRLNMYIRGLGLVLAEPGGDMDELLRWWDTAALGQMDSVESLRGLTNTLRPPDEIAKLATTRRTALTREIRKAEKAGDAETVAALSAELNTMSQGRYLPTDEVVANATTSPPRRKAEPSEVAANQLEPADPAALTNLRTELAGTESRYNELNHQVITESEELRGLDLTIRTAEAPAPAASGATTESVISELEALAAAQRAKVPEGKVSYAELELVRTRSAALAESMPDDAPPEMEAELMALGDQVFEMNGRLWTAEPKSVRKQAEAISKNLPMATAPAATMTPDAQAALVERATALRRSINVAQDELDELIAQRTSMQQRIDDLDRAHAARSTSDPNAETPSMVEDPIGAAQAEGLPTEGMSPETAPTHLVDDAIFDSDAAPEDLLREYDSVVAQSRALLNQYGSYKDMPPDVKRSAGELANRANALANRREETFAAATKGFSGADESRLIAAAQSAAQAANPRIDLDWWTTISTGTPPSHVATELLAGSGVNRRGVVRNQMRTTLTRSGSLRRGGSPFRRSLKARAEVLSGRHDPRISIKRRNPRTGRMRSGPLSDRPLTRFEQRARQVERFNTAERDLRGIGERARAEIDPLTGRIAEAEATIAQREAGFAEATAAFAERGAHERAESLADSQIRLNHANDAVSQAERHAQRVSGQRERINDAYTRALESENIQLGNVRRRAVEVKVDHEAAAHELALMRGAMREPKGSNLRQLWGDVRDLMKLKASQGPQPPIALGPVGSTAAAAAKAERGWQRRGPFASGAGQPGVPKGVPFDISSSQPEIRQIEALLAAAIDQQDQIDALDLHGGVIAKRLKDFERAPKKHAFFTPEQMLAMPEAEAKRFEDVFERVIADGWQAVAEDMFTGPDALVIANTLQEAMDNIRRTVREPGFWKVIEKYTAFFSTYATMKPGFHVRNAMSGTFMNLVDGVKMSNIRKAPGVWREFMSDPEAFWARTGPQADQHRAALMAVFGSGAGGAFSERGLTEAVTAGGKVYRKLMNNTLTKWNRKAGAYVEGPMRLAMALDSIERGMSLDAALDRITKFHFDYTQLSEMDVIARRMVPFWTFMSRNLPLQIESMWLRPRTYLQYQSLVRNFGQEMHPYTPDYWLSQGAFTLDENAPERDAPWYLAPDLPHLRVAEPLTALAQGDLGRAVLSDINPLFLAPVEALAAGKKFYTGQRITDEPREPQGVGEAGLGALLQLIGMGPEGASGQTIVDPRVAHIANSTLPPLEFLNRLTSNEGTRAGRQGETIARTFGAPVYKLTPEVQEATRRSEYYDRLDERQRQAQLARL